METARAYVWLSWTRITYKHIEYADGMLETTHQDYQDVLPHYSPTINLLAIF